jgi:hypothetical protein
MKVFISGDTESVTRTTDPEDVVGQQRIHS